ncbi:MAG: PAS domain S-box protein [Bryobacteraceae bacterium]
MGDSERGADPDPEVRALRERLREAEQALALTRHSLECASDGVFWLDPSGRYVYANEATTRLTGCSRQELLSMRAYDFNPAATPEFWLSRWEELKRRGSLVYETTLHAKGGRIIPVEITATYVLSGADEYFFGFVRDITARQQAEEAVRASESRFRRLFDNVPVAVVQTDQEGRADLANPAALQLLGYGSLAELRTVPLADFIADPAERELLTRRANEQGQILNAEVLAKRQDGSLLPVLLSGRLNRRSAADPPHFECMFVDITERKRTEELILQIAHGVAATTGDEFFHSLVEHLARALEADCALVGELVPGDASRLRTLAVFCSGARAPNFECALDNIACAGMQASAGAPLFDSTGRRLGQLAVMFRRSVADTGLAGSMLEIFAARAAAELERSQAEQARRKSDRRYREFIARSSEAVWCVEFKRPIPEGLADDQLRERVYRDGYIAQCNDAYARMRGLRSAAEAIGAPIQAIVPHSAWQGIVAALPPVDAERNFVLQEVDAQGRPKYYLRSHNNVFANGFLQQIWAVALDITERTRAEDLARESERRFRELLETVQLVAVMLDTAGDITFCNDYLLRLTGWSATEAMGQNWFDLFVPAREREETRSMFALGLAQKDLPAHHENPILTRNGVSRLIAWDNTLLRSPQGRVVGTASLGRDITEHRALEESFRQAQRLESVGRLAGGVAHDFNNLLSVINGYSEMLLQRVDPLDPIRADLLEVYDAGRRAAVLTQQLLAFSRRQLLKPELLDLNEVLTDAGSLLRRLIGEDIELSLRLDPLPARVCADAGQMHQVVMNLAVNARDAMPSGGQIVIQCANVAIPEGAASPEPGLPPGRYALLSVGDTGAGMTEEVKAHAFEPFFTTKGPGKGTGLGLATVYGIVEQSGGRIFVESQPGQGSTFRIYLPAVQQAMAARATADSAKLSDFQGTETILLVEDQPAVRKLMRNLLTSLGYQVLEAGDGNEALALAQQAREPFQLMLTDLVMPGMNGLELAARLIALRPGTRVLYISGYADRMPEVAGAPNYQDNSIAKPFVAAQLAAKVREVLDRPGPQT